MTRSSSTLRLSPIALLIASLFTSADNLAQVIADPSARSAERPIILRTANGLPQIDITAPTSAGVSMNRFSQFNVDAQGAIINNGRTASSTALAGWVSANPALIAQPARVIVGAINQALPSQINGYVEIAGNKADLILTNPAGITCNSCGFIHANRVELATGSPLWNGQQVTGYAMGSGPLQVVGRGMDARDVDAVSLLTEAAQINAGLWSKEVKLTLTNPAASTSTASSAPTFALDVASIGGMYANKIFLVGTAHGLGARNAGLLQADQQLVLSIDGKLENSGTIDAPDVRLTATQIDNVARGQVFGDTIKIDTDRLANAGHPDAAPVIAAANRVDIGVRELINTDHALIFSGGDMSIGRALDSSGQAIGQAEHVINRAATIEALNKLTLTTQRLDNLNNGVTSEERQVGDSSQRWYLQPNGSIARYPIELFRLERWSRAGQYRWQTDGSRLTEGIPGKTPLPDVDGMDCDNEAATNCSATPGSAYPANDPAWAYFKLPPPDEPPPLPGVAPLTPTLSPPQPPTAGSDPDGSLARAYAAQQAQYDEAWAAYRAQQAQFDSALQARQQWETATTERRGALAEAINTYNQGFSSQLIRSWTQYNVQHSEYQSQVTSSDPGRLIAGGDLKLSGGQLINDKSQIIAGGKLSGTLENLNSIDATGTHRVHESGTSQFTKSNYHGILRNYSTREWGPLLPFNPADIVTTIVLPVTVTQEKTDVGTGAIDVATHRLKADGSSLFKVNPASGPLYATDPRFTRYRDWISSDVMLAQLKLDPALTQKRLGDGFIEQKLVREQIAQLTGRRWLPGNTNDEQQYAMLMNSGVQQAQTLQLKPGIALSAEQVAQLTSDLVWLVEKNVPLPDGSVQRVLVPQVYLRPQVGDLQLDGTLISGQSVDLIVTEALKNTGMLTAQGTVTLKAGSIENLGTVAGTTVTASADTDLVQRGGVIQASDGVTLTAGRDIKFDSTTQSSTRESGNRQGSGKAGRTNLDRIASVHITGSGPLVMAAGRDVALNAAAITNEGTGSTTIIAGRDLQLGTVSTHNEVAGTGRRDSQNYLRERSSNEVGTQIAGSSDVQLAAGRDISLRAAAVRSESGSVVLAAGQDATITHGQSTHDFEQGTHFTDSGILGSSSSTTRLASSRTDVAGSTVSGAQVAIAAGRDARITGSDVVSDKEMSVTAQHNVLIEAANATATESRYRKESQSGLMGSGGMGITIGSRSMTSDAVTTSTTAVGSTVGSTQSNVAITAGDTVTQTGSSVIAPQGNILIAGRKVDITEGRNTETTITDTKFKQTGITVAVSNPIVSAIQTTQQMVDAASNTKDGRMKALAAANTAMAASNAYDAVMAGQSKTIDGKENQIATKDAAGNDTSRDANAADKFGGIQVSVSIGSSKSGTHTVVNKSEAVASNVAAAGRVTITATGDKTQSDLTVQGSQIAAGQQVNLIADHALNLQAASSTQTQQSNNSSSSASLGVVLDSRSGFGVNVSGSKGRGNADGSDLTWSNTTVSAGQKAQLQSVGDTALKGAVVAAPRVTVASGGQLSIESLQDSSTYTSGQKQVGGSATIGPASSANLNYAKINIDSTYISVTEQSGIRAGDGGFDVKVAGDTQLTGGAITSAQNAVDAGSNQFSTGGQLNTTDIENRAQYTAKSVSVNIGTGYSAQGKLAPAGTGVGLGNDSGSSASTTHSVISNIAGNAAIRTGDKETGIAKIFDLDKAQREINAQVTITQEFSWRANKMVGEYIESQQVALQKSFKSATSDEEKQQIKQKQSDLRNTEHALNILIGAVTGVAGAAVTKEALSTAAEKMRDLMVEDSQKFKGVTDGKTTISNMSGDSDGVRHDEIKLGGTRMDLDALCGEAHYRCESNMINGKPVVTLDNSGLVIFKEKNAGMSLENFLQTDEGKKLAGLTGGIQGTKGTLFGIPYAAGSWQDHLIESFAGTHDFIGGRLSGLYDTSGNIAQGMSNRERVLYDRWADVAVIPSAPFALAERLSPAVWQAISILLKEAK
jgi:filamentous hemagglutinin